MLATSSIDLKVPPNLNSKEFANNKYEYYKWMREEAPVFRTKLSILEFYILSRYEDCVSILKDPRFVRDKSQITGGSGLPFPAFIPIPKSVELMTISMIVKDEPDHKRLRTLVHQAFTQKALAQLSDRIEHLTHELLDNIEPKGTIDLKKAYALPIPVTVIREMVGVSDEDMPRFYEGFKAMIGSFSGTNAAAPLPWRVARTLFWNLPRLSTFVRTLIKRKRSHPEDDILTRLIQAEEAGATLSEDEIVSMVFLLIVAGYETTVQLITNGTLALLQHPEQLTKLRENPDLIEPAVEEILRFCGPVHATKPMYATEDVVLHGVTIPKRKAVMPFLGAANRDPSAFHHPDTFDIERSPNKHLGFGGGIHACLGAPLARMEVRIALTNLIARNPNLRLAVHPSALNVQVRPGWHTYDKLEVALG